MIPRDLETLIEAPVLRTERLALRPPRAADLPGWTAFVAEERSAFVGGPLSQGRAWRAWASIIGHWLIRGYGTFVITPAGDLDRGIGQVGPWHPGEWPEPEIGWSLWSAEVEGRGLAAEAARAAIDHAFRDLGWQTAVSYIDPDNAGSIAVAERLGAVRDDTARRPDDGDLVYRHPLPEAA